MTLLNEAEKQYCQLYFIKPYIMTYFFCVNRKEKYKMVCDISTCKQYLAGLSFCLFYTFNFLW